MASVSHLSSCIPVFSIPRLNHKRLELWKPLNLLGQNSRHSSVVCHSTSSKWVPDAVTHDHRSDGTLLKDTSNIFETMNSLGEPGEEASITKTELLQDGGRDWPFVQLRFLRRPFWLLGPALLLITGVVPTLWLPISSVFIGPNIASLLSFTGLDCIFNLGASLFLLMADSTARFNNSTQSSSSKPPPSYQFWNMAANVSGLIIPVATILASQNGVFQPQLPPIAFAVLLAPYLLLLSVQIVTEMLTWHWESPVWLVTPVVYELYRLLQLMRGLNLGLELGAPSWTMHMVRVLVCGWVVVLGVQLMRVAWYAGFTARAYNKQTDASSTDGY